VETDLEKVKIPKSETGGRETEAEMWGVERKVKPKCKVGNPEKRNQLTNNNNSTDGKSRRGKRGDTFRGLAKKNTKQKDGKKSL